MVQENMNSMRKSALIVGLERQGFHSLNTTHQKKKKKPVFHTYNNSAEEDISNL